MCVAYSYTGNYNDNEKLQSNRTDVDKSFLRHNLFIVSAVLDFQFSIPQTVVYLNSSISQSYHEYNRLRQS